MDLINGVHTRRLASLLELALESSRFSPAKIGVAVEKFPLTEPFHITGHTMVDAEVLTVEIEADGLVGRGEASGVYYRQFDNPRDNARQIEAVRGQLQAGVSRGTLQALMPRGGARNALDCALWDLEAKTTGRAAWQIAGLKQPEPLVTTAYRQARAIKLKLTGQPIDADRVRAVAGGAPRCLVGGGRKSRIHAGITGRSRVKEEHLRKSPRGVRSVVVRAG